MKDAFLRPGPGLAESYPCPDPKNAGTVHKVVIHGPDHILGVCPDGCPPERLARDDIVIWELRRSALAEAVAKAFRLRDGQTQVEGLAGTWRVGTYAPYAGFRFAVYLTIGLEPSEVRRAVDGLLARDADPFVLLAPTRDLCAPASEDRLKRRKACFVPLSDVLMLDERAGLVLAEGPTVESVLADFREAVLPKPAEESGMVIFPTPADATWEQVRIRFTDGHTASVAVGDASGVYHYSQMGMADRRNARPTKQWELLRDFADERGILDWGSHKADRKLQKRREDLGKGLRRFFRIEGDPFVSEGNGWRARFDVSLGE